MIQPSVKTPSARGQIFMARSALLATVSSVSFELTRIARYLYNALLRISLLALCSPPGKTHTVG